MMTKNVKRITRDEVRSYLKANPTTRFKGDILIALERRLKGHIKEEAVWAWNLLDAQPYFKVVTAKQVLSYYAKKFGRGF